MDLDVPLLAHSLPAKNSYKSVSMPLTSTLQPDGSKGRKAAIYCFAKTACTPAHLSKHSLRKSQQWIGGLILQHSVQCRRDSRFQFFMMPPKVGGRAPAVRGNALVLHCSRRQLMCLLLWGRPTHEGLRKG